MLTRSTRRSPSSLSYGERVLKQNRGSTGSGIWRVQLEDKELAASIEPGTTLPLDTKLRCTEAVDNHTEVRELGEFMDFCDQYIIGDNGMLVDMRFMPRIVEGEIRILLVGPHPVFVVHKKPAAGGDNFSATLFSGAQYTYDSPEKWQELVDMFAEVRPVIAEKLGGDNIPLIWTADFMLDDAPGGGDTYVSARSTVPASASRRSSTWVFRRWWPRKPSPVWRRKTLAKHHCF